MWGPAQAGPAHVGVGGSRSQGTASLAWDRPPASCPPRGEDGVAGQGWGSQGGQKPPSLSRERDRGAHRWGFCRGRSILLCDSGTQS